MSFHISHTIRQHRLQDGAYKCELKLGRNVAGHMRRAVCSNHSMFHTSLQLLHRNVAAHVFMVDYRGYGDRWIKV